VAIVGNVTVMRASDLAPTTGTTQNLPLVERASSGKEGCRIPVGAERKRSVEERPRWIDGAASKRHLFELCWQANYSATVYYIARENGTAFCRQEPGFLIACADGQTGPAWGRLKCQLLRPIPFDEAQFRSNGVAYQDPTLALRTCSRDGKVEQSIGNHIVLGNALAFVIHETEHILRSWDSQLACATVPARRHHEILRYADAIGIHIAKVGLRPCIAARGKIRERPGSKRIFARGIGLRPQQSLYKWPRKQIGRARPANAGDGDPVKNRSYGCVVVQGTDNHMGCKLGSDR
jgi:hypothetical protein